MRFGYSHNQQVVPAKWKKILEDSLQNNNNEAYLDETITSFFPEMVKNLRTYYDHLRSARATHTKLMLARETQTLLTPLTEKLMTIPQDQQLPKGLRVVGVDGIFLNPPAYYHILPGRELGNVKDSYVRVPTLVWEKQQSEIKGNLIAPASFVQRSFDIRDIPSIPIGEYGPNNAVALASVADLLHARIKEFFKEDM